MPHEVDCSVPGRFVAVCLPYNQTKRTIRTRPGPPTFQGPIATHIYIRIHSFMTDSDIRPSAVSATPLARLRRALLPVLLPILGFGMAACVDALQTELRLPEHTFFITPGETVELSGAIRAPHSDPTPTLRLSIIPDTVPVTLTEVATDRQTFSDDTVWRVNLRLGEAPVRTSFRADVSFPELHHQGLQSWNIEAFPDAASLRESSPSLLFSKLGIEPLPTAFICLVTTLLLTLLYFALYLVDRKKLARRGYLRVFHARKTGPDTLLYCVQPESDAPTPGASYRVLSATGQLLGMAELNDSGRRHCIFRLHAARARAGCIVAVR